MKFLKKVLLKIKNMFMNLLESLYFFWYKHFVKKPKILSFEDTIKLINEKQLSIARYGDGEMKLILKTGFVGFQKADDSLSGELRSSFETNKSNLLVCYHDIPFSFPKRSEEYKFYKQYLFKTYRPCLKLIDKKYFYGNTNFTRFYHPSLFEKTDFNKLDKYVCLLKTLWNEKNLLIVEGSETKLGLGNNLFDNCASMRRIICPKTNAYEKIDDIFKCIVENHHKDDLVLVALGPTASVLCTRISVNTDIQAIDIGHIDIVYLWFINKCKTICKFSGKYVNEAKKDAPTIVLSYNEDLYRRQIIATI